MYVFFIKSLLVIIMWLWKAKIYAHTSMLNDGKNIIFNIW